MNRILILGLGLFILVLLITIPAVKVLGVSAKEEMPLRYVEYSDSLFQSEANNNRAICFLADWCEYCQQIDTQLKSSSRLVPKNAIIFKADFEKEVALKKKYAVNIKHECLVFNKDGNVIKRVSPEKILSVLSLQ